jgi:hypothetical protein
MRVLGFASLLSIALLAACTSSSDGGATSTAATTTATGAGGGGGAGGGSTATGTGGSATGTTTTTTTTTTIGAGGAASTGGAGGAPTTTSAGGAGGAGGATWTTACAAGLAVELEPILEGLLYMSESDYPFEDYSVADSGAGPITPAHLLDLLGLPADTVTETRTVDQFFEWPLQGDDGAKYQQLHDVLELRLTDLAVIRVFDPQNQAQVHVFVIGRTGCAEIAGVRTIAIET